MNRWYLCCLLLIAVGCSGKEGPQGPIVAKVGQYVITKEEFETAYRESINATNDNAAARKAFLDNMINQKLIMLDAQRQGLDKKPEFLLMVERFYQQSLLTQALKQKVKEGGDLEKWVQYLRANTPVTITQEEPQ